MRSAAAGRPNSVEWQRRPAGMRRPRWQGERRVVLSAWVTVPNGRPMRQDTDIDRHPTDLASGRLLARLIRINEIESVGLPFALLAAASGARMMPGVAAVARVRARDTPAGSATPRGAGPRIAR